MSATQSGDCRVRRYLKVVSIMVCFFFALFCCLLILSTLFVYVCIFVQGLMNICLPATCCIRPACQNECDLYEVIVFSFPALNSSKTMSLLLSLFRKSPKGFRLWPGSHTSLPKERSAVNEDHTFKGRGPKYSQKMPIICMFGPELLS